MFVNDVPFSTATLDDYRSYVGDEVVDRVRRLAEPLRGSRVLHVNATEIGGGVVEILLSLVPLMRDIGLDTDWYVLEAPDHFFEVTKSYHNALQGKHVPWSQEAFDAYWEGCAENARRLAETGREYDFVVIHDPQPLVLRSQMQTGGSWIWRCHIDLTEPWREVWEKFSPHLALYDLVVFSTPEYVAMDIEVDRMETALPCIDPFREKNRMLAPEQVTEIIARYGVDLDRPYLLQVSRFDPWKDPLGVLEVYRQLKPRWPKLQLVYMASMAADDPEGAEIYEQTRSAAGDDPDIHLLALEVPPHQVAQNALEVNAMQRGARVVLQKSIREGFGLTVTEALWKEKATVGGNTGGIHYQIRDGWNGYLVNSIEECVVRVDRLLRDPELSATFGRRGHETVISNFLFTRLLEQYLTWFGALAHDRAERRRNFASFKA